MSDSSKTNTEQRFTTLPHPAKDNNPGVGAGLVGGNPAILAHHAREPHVPSQDRLNKLDAPLSREELKRRAEELNKE